MCEYSNIRREDEGHRFFPEVGCNLNDFIREVLHLMQHRNFPIQPFKAVCVFCETSTFEIELDHHDDDESAIRKYRAEFDEICRAYGDDV